MRRIVLGIMLMLLLTGMLMSAFHFHPIKAESTTITVPDDYPKIQEAINHASSGYTIFVRNGTYHEQVVIDKDNLALIGESKFSTIIDGDETRLYGVYMLSRKGVTVENFKVVGVKTGICLHSSSSYNNIINNVVSYNEKGITLARAAAEGPSYNSIIENAISCNIEAGLYLDSAKNNEFFHNNFINNTSQVKWCGSSSVNTWDDGYPSGGNHWSNYVGEDISGDEIGDTPHVIDSNNTDRYPLMNPYPLRGLVWPMFHNNLRHTGYSESMAPKTNATLWTYTTQGRVHSSPTVAYGLVYIGSSDCNIYALKATTGALVWNYTTGGVVGSSPTIAYGMVFVGSSDRKLYALDAMTGECIWSNTTDSGIKSSPAAAYGKVYVGSSNKLYCFDATTGEPSWDYPIGWVVWSSPAVADGIVYFSYIRDVYTGGVCALNATTGKSIWNSTPPIGPVQYSSPAVAYGMVFVGCLDKKVYAFNSATGEQVWSYPTNGVIDSSPAVADGRVFIGSHDSNIYCLNASAVSMSSEARKLWNCSTGRAVESSPAIAYGMVFIGSNDNKTYALNAKTGKHVWNYTGGGPVSSSPAIAYGILFVGSYDNNTYAFGSPDITITGVKSFNNVVCQNFTTEIYVNVTNQFVFDATFNLTLTVNETVIQTEEVNLTGLNSTTITFTWNTTGFDIGNYTISAVADAVANEGDISDNAYIDGIVAVRSPIYDIAVTNVTRSKSVVGQSFNLTIAVTAANRGDYTETLNITLYGNTTVIATQDVPVTSLNSATITFTWNTTDFGKGNYTIWAYACPVPGEIHTSDNTCTDGWVFVALVGDINGNRKVDLDDVLEVALAYDAKPGPDGQYRHKPPCRICADRPHSPNCDIDDNDVIDLTDYLWVVINYGKVGP